jgi:hypothetical protein
MLISACSIRSFQNVVVWSREDDFECIVDQMGGAPNRKFRDDGGGRISKYREFKIATVYNFSEYPTSWWLQLSPQKSM